MLLLLLLFVNEYLDFYFFLFLIIMYSYSDLLHSLESNKSYTSKNYINYLQPQDNFNMIGENQCYAVSTDLTLENSKGSYLYHRHDDHHPIFTSDIYNHQRHLQASSSSKLGYPSSSHWSLVTATTDNTDASLLDIEATKNNQLQLDTKSINTFDLLFRNNKRLSIASSSSSSPPPLLPTNTSSSSQYYQQLSMDLYPPLHYSSPSSTTTRLDNTKFHHPRIKSAYARLPPFSEKEKDVVVYQQFLSPPLAYNHTIINQNFLMMKDEPRQRINLSCEAQVKHQEFSSNTSFQFNVALHATPAITKKLDEQPTTYLNRGQAYLIDLDSVTTKTNNNTLVTSTISIAFHESSHRRIADSYWKYWVNQQENSMEARAIHIDAHQCTGVYNVRFISFDKVSFDWNGRFGAKIYIRFNCLSTDFSRIKGVKGIPMRVEVETCAHYTELPNDSISYKGTFHKLTDTAYEYKEICYCKIKLFRDKGAERKNKDDKKQITKQLEKIMATSKVEPNEHPLWSLMNQPDNPISKLTEIDSPHNTKALALDNLIPLNNKSCKRKRNSSDQPSQPPKQKLKGTTKEVVVTYDTTTALQFYVWTRDFPHVPREVSLDLCTTENLKVKLAHLLFIHPSKISEMLWRKKQPLTSDIFVLIEDTFITEHILDGEMIVLNWEMKTNGDIRLILEF
ncbi:CP2 transcription factor-domain-containing protein [Cokeromyces recurvatus]|uniref:CP2 transcription factor-domain-containing protein n=1 Tax=Cokeromyces recurvatus TaxID=90255 RepID=UPI00221F139C|nr:CP2 transcription factor-domain-containing protein [Cokeromyces recurvatus]KAI7907523.1 CP2 transcription factor-domain-containing protein [Cokeromyces recurvatus]